MSQRNLTGQVAAHQIDWSEAPEGAEKYNLFNNTFYRGERPNLEIFIPGVGWTNSYLMPSNENFVMRERAWPATGTLPPVGTVCEYYWPAGDSWREGTCVAHFQGRAVVCDHVDADCAEQLYAHHVRPIRTPEQIAAEERERELAEMREIVKQAHYALPNTEISPSEKAAAYVIALYDAGYRKQLI